MNRYVIDAYAWIEYFDGTVSGKKAKEIIEDPQQEIHTQVITLAELASHFRRRGIPFDEAKKIIFSLSSIYPCTPEFAEGAGTFYADIKKERKHMSLADVFVLFTARQIQGKVITGDEDFRGLREVVMIK